METLKETLVSIRSELAKCKISMTDLEFALNGAEEALKRGNKDVNLAKAKARKTVIK